MYISVTAFLFCLGFAVLLGCFFAWIYNYRNLHKDPRGKPHKVTNSVTVPIELASDAEQNGTAIKRLELEKTCYDTSHANKDAFIKKLLALFRSRLEQDNYGVLSVCYWVFNGDGFTIRLCNSPYRISENLFVPKSDKCFSKNNFNCNGQNEIPLDVFESGEQIVYSMAGAAISGDGKLRGYITIDSSKEHAFDDEVCMELRELSTLTEEMLRIQDLNLILDRENTLFNGMITDSTSLFKAASKGNLIANLSKILQDNFNFDRLMIIIQDEKNNEKWRISEAVGEQKEDFKEVSFNVHVKCLLYELLAGKVLTVNETKISTDPYQRRFYENEPENLNLHSLFAVMPPVQNNSYPIAIVLESKKNRAVSTIDEILLTHIVACAALKLADIQSKDDSISKKELDLAGIDANGLGELQLYYETEINKLKDSEDSLGILFFKCVPVKDGMAVNYEKFLSVLKKLKKAWNGQHLAMLGSGEFVFSVKGNFNENIFDLTAKQIITNAENMLTEDNLQIKNHSILLNKEKIESIESNLGQEGTVLFAVSVMNKFKEMSEIEASL